jgi:hypothetical protein
VGQPATHPGPVVSNPGLGQEVRGQQLGQDPRVDLVRLHLRLGDRSRLARVRHHHLCDERAQHRRDGVAISSGLQGDLVIGLERRRPLTQVLRLHADPSLITTQAVLNDGDLRERTRCTSIPIDLTSGSSLLDCW